MENIQNKYIEVAYKLYAREGERMHLVEETKAGKPFCLITGFGIALDEFEKTVSGLGKGESFDITLPPEQAYGDYSEDRVLSLDREIFTVNGHFDHENIYEDAMVPLQNEAGKRFMGRVVEIKDDKVVMDLNHPLAGMEINFKGQIMESREATNDEIQRMINHLSGEDCGCGCGCHDHDGCHEGHDGCCEGGHKHHGGCCGGH